MKARLAKMVGQIGAGAQVKFVEAIFGDEKWRARSFALYNELANERAARAESST